MNWLENLKQKAKKSLPRPIYDFVEGGAGDESALFENYNAFKQISIIPRVLQDVSHIDTELSLCGAQLTSPIIIAPTTPQKLLHPEGELATVKAAAETNSLMIVGCMASATLEDIAKASAALLWFQLQIFKNRALTANLIQRAVDAGYKAIVITVDVPCLGERKRDIKNRFKIPDDCLSPNYLTEESEQDNNKLRSRHINQMFDPAATWEDIKILRKQTTLPIILKGILHPDDARLALEAGVDAIIVSNHGGRQFGSAIAPLQILPAIVDAVNNRIPVLVDGGIQSGEDVLKALALGAQAVLSGRAVLWGLAVGGQAGAGGVIKQLNRELRQAMMHSGFADLRTIKQAGKACLYFKSIEKV